MLARLAANFAKLWSARGKATALGGRGTVTNRADVASIPRCVASRFHHPPKAAARRRAHSKVLRTKRAPHFLTPSQSLTNARPARISSRVFTGGHHGWCSTSDSNHLLPRLFYDGGAHRLVVRE